MTPSRIAELRALCEAANGPARNSRDELRLLHTARTALPEALDEIERLTKSWRCFHCGELFTDQESARIHFGFVTMYEPGCIDPLHSDEKEMRGRAVRYERSWRKALSDLDAARTDIDTLKGDLRASEEREAKLRSLVMCLIDNDPYDSIADGGVVVLDQWRKDARSLLGMPEPAIAEAERCPRCGTHILLPCDHAADEARAALSVEPTS
jgi:hypothetical protein